MLIEPSHAPVGRLFLKSCFLKNGGTMKEKSRIRFNPLTKEIEVEGTEQFVKTYFGKLQAMISGPSQKTVTIMRQPKAVKAAPEKKVEKKPTLSKPSRVSKVKKAPAKKKVTNIDTVVGLIQGAPEGISTAELKTKTGLAETQIWNIVTRASKIGKIKKVKRGVYGAS
jgi:hypothetical protein